MTLPKSNGPGFAPPVILWLHRELRLHDNPALRAAADTGSPVLPVFVLDDASAGDWKTGAAQRWWLHHSLARLQEDFQRLGAPLLLRRGRLSETLLRLVEETGASALHGGQPIEGWARAEVAVLKAALGDRLHLHRTALLYEPGTIRTKAGGDYGVFTPFANACRAQGAPEPPRPAPARLKPAHVPDGDTLDRWRLLPTKPDWAGGMRETWVPGEAGGARRLAHFVEAILGGYDRTRNLPATDGTSMLSPHLHWGEVSPGQVWHAVAQAGAGPGATAYLTELLWRDFSAHMLVRHPDLPEQPLRPAFKQMPWRSDPALLGAWTRGRTGIPIVDAGMRQLWQQGWMHNRLRMITSSFLVKHLLVPWEDGQAWFWDTLVDADLASNAGQWQWVAGCGADASPFFRIFNPVLQGRKFDPGGDYVRRFVPELAGVATRSIHAPWELPAAQRPRGYPAPVVDLAGARDRALGAFRKLPKSAA